MPSDDELSRVYQGFGEGLSEALQHDVAYRETMYGRLLDVLAAQRQPPGSILDVGCSTGTFLEAAADRGWAPTGIEIDEGAAKHAAGRLNVPIHTGRANAVLPDLGSFDVIVMSHVLEHVNDPRATLDLVSSHLRPGGILLLRAPNARGRSATLTRARWSWFRPPIHLSYFSDQTIDRMARNWNWVVVARFHHRGDAHVFPVELVAASMRLRTAQPPPKSPSPASGGGPRLVRTGLRTLDEHFPFRGWFSRNDDSELVAYLRRLA